MKSEHPKVEARAIRRKDGIWDLFITCPYCGKEHHHGGGNGSEPNYGFRASHCSGLNYFPNDYELIPAAEERVIKKHNTLFNVDNVKLE